MAMQQLTDSGDRYKMDQLEEEELDRIREDRMEQLKHQSAGFVSLKHMYAPGQAGTPKLGNAKEAFEEGGIAEVLEHTALIRLRTIAGGLHGSERATRIEAIIHRMASQGQLGGKKVSESTVLKLLDSLNEQYDAGAGTFSSKQKLSNGGFNRIGKRYAKNNANDSDSDASDSD